MHKDAPANVEELAAAYQKERRIALEALGSYQKQGPISYNVGLMADMLMDESDRGVVVILASLLEDILLERLLGAFISLQADERKNLTRAGGLLSNFDDRINLAHALGLIEVGLVDSLQIIKAMRNACAHSRRHIDFQTEELRNVLALLFDDESATVIRNSKTTVFLRICFITQFVVLSEIANGAEPESARSLGQSLLDAVLAESERQHSSQKKRKPPPKKRSRRNPTG